LCLTNLIAFYNGMTSSVDKQTTVVVIYFDLNETFDMVSCSIHEFKFRHFSLNEWFSTRVKNCLNCWNQREPINGLYSAWRPAMSGITLCNWQYSLETQKM